MISVPAFFVPILLVPAFFAMPVRAALAADFTIGGSLTGLEKTESITLELNGKDPLKVAANGKFTFTTALATGATYTVKISATPAGETCTVTGGTGTVAHANVTAVHIACALKSYTIGGTISGLAAGGSVTLTLEGKDTQTFEKDGAFTFTTKVDYKTSYAVMLDTESAGQACMVTAHGTGTVPAAAVTDVSVACSATGSPYWIPYHARGYTAPAGSDVQQGSVPAGKNGVFVIPSNKISATPAPQWITEVPVDELGESFDITLSGNTVTNYQPGVLMYAAQGKDGNLHVYGAKLNDIGSVPKPVQIGTLSIDLSTEQYCSVIAQGQTNLSDASTLFAIFGVAGTATSANPYPCQGSDVTYYVVSYEGTTNKIAINPSYEEIQPLYHGDSLSGLLMLDATTNKLLLYGADLTFNSPATLLDGVGSYEWGAISLGSAGQFLSIGPSSGSSVTEGLYVLPGGSDAVKLVQAGSVKLFSQDDKNVYWANTSSSTKTDLYQMAVSGTGKPLLLYSGPATATVGTGSTQKTSPLIYQAVGSNGSMLIFGTETLSSGAYTTTLHSIPVGKLTATPAIAGGPYKNGTVSFGSLFSPVANDLADSIALANITLTSGTYPNITYTDESVAIVPGGPYTQKPTLNSSYLLFSSLSVGPGVYQMKTAAGGGDAHFYTVDFNSPQTEGTELTTTGGGAYIVPSGYGPVLVGYQIDNAGAGFLSPSKSGPQIGLAIDAAKNFILPLAVANTDVVPFSNFLYIDGGEL